MTLIDTVDANDFKNFIVSGANNIFKHQEYVNDLNVFPVPDGDTGTNMCLTISGVTDKLSTLKPDASVTDVANMISYAALRSSRGNSGVILAIILKGFSQHLHSHMTMVAEDFVSSLEIGVENAYRAVMRPTEGTMLTVARVAAEYGRKSVLNGDSFVNVLESICLGARTALDDTPNLLPVLKKAGVVDAGGKGLCLILEGILFYLRNDEIVSRDISSISPIDDNKFEQETKKFDDDIRFTYCTEFIVEKYINCKFNPDILRKNLERIGDCVIIMHDSDVIKGHVHSNSPDKVLRYALNYGKLVNVKIDNLEKQKKEMETSNAPLNVIEDPVEITKELGTLSIANGSGIIGLFKNLGCDEVLEGGQTLNPSAEQIASAASRVPAKKILVFPNNKNILLAADQASKIVKDRILVIVPTKFIPQGISSMIAFNDSLSAEENYEEMVNQMSLVKTGLITYAARDADFCGFKMKKGESLSLLDGKLVNVAKNYFESLKFMLTKIPTSDCMTIDVYYSSGQERVPDFVSSEVKLSKSLDINFIASGLSHGEIIIGYNY